MEVWSHNLQTGCTHGTWQTKQLYAVELLRDGKFKKEI